MKMQRRNFLLTAARGLALTGLVGGSGYLATRRSSKTAACLEKGICHTCGVNKGCHLPQAMAYRRHIDKTRQKDSSQNSQSDPSKS
jgi:hypothetical protein